MEMKLKVDVEPGGGANAGSGFPAIERCLPGIAHLDR